MGYIASLYNSGVGALQIGIRAGLPVGNPFYWSMSRLVFVKVIYKLKMSCENPLRILFTPYPIHSNLGDILPLFDLTVLLLVCNSNLGSRGWLLPLVYWLGCFRFQNPK